MKIHIEALANNPKGDLFNERMKDLVHALGYEVTRVNISLPGRELDILGQHRLEERTVVVECKAQSEKIGGPDINKFIGALDAQRSSGASPVTGYFVSLSGFKDSALEQESQTGRLRCVLLGPDAIRDQLEAANVLTSRAEVLIAVAKSPCSDGFEVQDEVDLIVHSEGWFSLVRLERQGRAAIALVYPSGAVVPQADAQRIMASLAGTPIDADVECLGVADDGNDIAMEEARDAYLDYLTAEYGVIRNDGLPMDAQVASGKPLMLEDMYIPLRLVTESAASTSFPISDASQFFNDVPLERSDSDVLSLSESLVNHRHISILGPPGSGKSTLIKRLAVAYGDASRRGGVADELPDMEILPIVLRCRDVVGPGTTIQGAISDLPRIAEMTELSEPFARFVSRSLDHGDVMLLVDGLDEIVDAGDRKQFAAQLRTFLTRYPLVRAVITSRNAGYRAVAGALRELSEVFQLVEMNSKDIGELTRAWFRHVYGDAENHAALAEGVASTIVANPRIRRLAGTPLLLTTLLIVQRWSGGQELPRRRAVLYSRAVEVLLNTWNVEGHQPLDMDESVPQLAYLAFAMTTGGRQRVPRSDALVILRDARRALPEVLAYARSGPREFLNSVELRSSLLTNVGFMETESGLEPAYEFKHLLFQEYLTAVAIVDDWTSEMLGSNAVEILREHWSQPEWIEVVSLAAVLAGRGGRDLVSAVVGDLQRSVGARRDGGVKEESDEYVLCEILHACLADEVAMDPPLVREVARLVCEFDNNLLGSLDDVMTSKYADDVRGVVEAALVEHWESVDISGAAACIFDWEHRNDTPEEVVDLIKQLIQNSERVPLSLALSWLMQRSYEGTWKPDSSGSIPGGDGMEEALKELLSPILSLVLETSDSNIRRLALWASC